MMKLITVGMLITLLTTFTAFANPPADFLKDGAKVVDTYGSVQSLNVSNDAFVNQLKKESSSAEWEKVSEHKWIYRVVRKDDATKALTRIAVVFDKVEGTDGPVITRVLANDLEMKPGTRWMFVGEEAGHAVLARPLDGKFQPATSFLDLHMDTGRDITRYNVADFADYFRSSGASILWRQQPGRQIIMVVMKDNTSYGYGLIRDNCLAADGHSEYCARITDVYANCARKCESLDDFDLAKKAIKDVAAWSPKERAVRDAQDQKAAKAEEAKKAKEQAESDKIAAKLKRVSGHYENQNGKDSGEVDIELVASESINVNFTGKGCKLQATGLKIAYTKYNDQFAAKYKDGGCEVKFTFQDVPKHDRYLSIEDTIGSCPKLCKSDEFLTGNYPGK